MRHHLKYRPKLMEEIKLKLHMLDYDSNETMIYIESILSVRINLTNIKMIRSNIIGLKEKLSI